jgi:hypothetical protein
LTEQINHHIVQAFLGAAIEVDLCFLAISKEEVAWSDVSNGTIARLSWRIWIFAIDQNCGDVRDPSA